MKRTINRFVFQKNFCKISSKDSSRYFAIIIPSVLSVFEEIKNLRNIFYNVVFFSNCKILLQHHIIKTKMKQRIWGLKKRYLTYVNIIHTLHFQLSLRYLRKKLIKSYFCFLCNYLLFFLQKIPSNQHPPPKNLHRPAIICGIITNQIWLKLANLPKW